MLIPGVTQQTFLGYFISALKKLEKRMKGRKLSVLWDSYVKLTFKMWNWEVWTLQTFHHELLRVESSLFSENSFYVLPKATAWTHIGRLYFQRPLTTSTFLHQLYMEFEQLLQQPMPVILFIFYCITLRCELTSDIQKYSLLSKKHFLIHLQISVFNLLHITEYPNWKRLTRII